MSKYNTYSKFAPHLLVQNNYLPYLREVELQLRLIRSTAMGRALFEAVACGSYNIRILPHSGPQKSGLPATNPFMRLDASSAWYPENAMEAGSDEYMPQVDGDGMYTPGKELIVSRIGVGWGWGADTVVEYSPAALREQVRRSPRRLQYAPPDVVLLHELTHAMRAGAGLSKSCNVQGDYSWDNYEEFCAHMVENVYRSERGLHGLRLHRHAHKLDDKVTAESDVAFHRRYAQDIDHWLDVQPTFFRAASFVRADFNPFRAAVLARDQQNIRRVSYPARSGLLR